MLTVSPPDIVDRPVLTDKASDHLPGVDANSHFERFVKAFPGFAHGIDHSKSHLRNRKCVTRSFFRQSAGRHVGIADGLYFFDLKALGQLIKS